MHGPRFSPAAFGELRGGLTSVGLLPGADIQLEGEEGISVL